MKNHFGYLFEALFGSRGFFIYQPFMIFSIFSLWHLRRKLSPAVLGAAAVSLISIVFYLYMTNEYGGAAYGFRYLIPLIPVLWYLAGIWLLEKKSKCLWGAAILFMLLGIIAALPGAYAPFCLAFEGHRSPEQHVTRKIRSSFMGNLLSWSYENDPDSFLTRKLRAHYGKETSRRYLFSSYLMLKKIEPMARISQEKNY